MCSRLLAIFVAFGCIFCLVPATRGADEEAIKKATEKGVAYLKSLQTREGTWPHQEIGATALAGLALLECDVPADSSVIQSAARAIREACPRITFTYSISLVILFLDRLGDPGDVPLIESLTVRLLAGQGGNGMWSYSCPAVSDAEVRRLTAVVNKQNELVGRRELPKPPTAQRTVNDLPDEIKKQLDIVSKLAAALPLSPPDNSNTQFAILALWVGRRQGLPVGGALARTDGHFRRTRLANGGWGYAPLLGGGGPLTSPIGPIGAPPPGADKKPGQDLDNVVLTSSTPAMTCAGLLGLALGYGVSKEAKGGAAAAPDLTKDQAIKAGLMVLGTSIGNPRGNWEAERSSIPVLDASTNRKGYYFLWSLERVGVAYNVETIGNKDWYGWGSEVILANQSSDGGWKGEYADSGADTAFALLFLRKANFAKDLTAALRAAGKDLERELKAGGVGGAAVLHKMNPAFGEAKGGKKPEKPEKPENPPKRRVEGEAARLSDELVKASADKQDRLLEEMKTGKGPVYTDALADAIARLTGERKAKAREALADRISDMSSKTIKDKLRDDDPEVRRAAALAAGMNDDRAHLPRLVELLDDEESFVGRAAYAVLKKLTKQDFGPAADASKDEKARASAKWKEWVANNAQK